MAAIQPPPADQAAAPAAPAALAVDGATDLPATAWDLMRRFVDAHATKPELRERLGLGAGSGRVKVLFLLRDQPRTLAQLAEAHGVDRPYATIIVDKLEDLGFVERTPHPSDRRSKVVSLTPAGWDAVALADQILGEPPAALRELDTDQLTELVGLLSLLGLKPAARGSVQWNGRRRARCPRRRRATTSRRRNRRSIRNQS
jgi:DNA-binding MarR family transcriptional regulator